VEPGQSWWSTGGQLVVKVRSHCAAGTFCTDFLSNGSMTALAQPLEKSRKAAPMRNNLRF
jgi:hypothetical protein